VDLGERAELLARQLIHPLVVGGAVVLQRPLGPKLALQIGVERHITDNDLRMAVDTARLRVARRLLAVDVLPDLDQSEWALAAALNDLLQVTNHELSSFASRGRHETLLAAARAICEAVPPPRSLQAAVARHATFSQLLSLSRVDTKVSWWTGSASFRGQVPPERLLAWPQLRNVRQQRERVGLPDMAEGVPVQTESFHAVLSAFLGCTPLTDLATIARAAPPFRWSAGSLAVVATVGGTNLALRAFEQQAPSAEEWRRSCRKLAKSGSSALEQATAQLADGSPEQAIAKQFSGQLRHAAKHWAGQVEA
jgi:hypothetical protein